VGAARKGSQVVIPYRSPDAARFLRPMGDLGQMVRLSAIALEDLRQPCAQVPLEFNARHDHQIEECVRHSDTVYNCIGREYQTRCGRRSSSLSPH
jgi:NADH dehydrogenase (ubiquinone) 1 alpha subcomplex subunit 9